MQKPNSVIKTINFPGVSITAISSPNTDIYLAIRLAIRPIQTLDKLVAAEFMSESMSVFLRNACAAGASVIFAGGTGSGKTTLLRAILAGLPGSSAIIDGSIELAGEQINSSQTLFYCPSATLSTGDAIGLAVTSGCDRLVVNEMRGWEASLIADYGASGGQVLTTTHASPNVGAVLDRISALIAADEEREGYSENESFEMGARAFGVVVTLKLVMLPPGTRPRRWVCGIDLVSVSKDPAGKPSAIDRVKTFHLFGGKISQDGTHIEFSDYTALAEKSGFGSILRGDQKSARMNAKTVRAAVNRIARRGVPPPLKIVRTQT
jgi:energy-coupling factor transporter ATP-binding protein EcfA2